MGDSEAHVREIGSRRELFCDRWLIDKTDRADLRLHHPAPQEIALPFDRPWEGPISFYVTILEYEGEVRAYYRGWQGEGTRNDCVAVATSPDGIAWTRPTLGLYEWEGSRENNICWVGEGAHAFSPFVDANPAATAVQRFKALAPMRGKGRRGLLPFASADGYRWTMLQQDPVITDGAFDSQNLAYWDSLRGHYVAFYRDFKDGVRDIKVSTSDDMLHWAEGKWLEYGSAPREHFYTNATISYPRAPHIYMAFPKRFVPDRKVVPEHPSAGLSDGVFMTSRDGLHWDRTFTEAFLRPGRDRNNWTERNMGIAWGIVQTACDELSIYWVENYRHPTCRLRRGTLRVDGFASVYAGCGGGELITHPLRFEGRALTLNYATSAAGSVRVELQDAQGRPLAGRSLQACDEIYGDEIERTVTWGGSADLAPWAGQAVRVRLALKDADVYALRFHGE
ncbi:MAG: hypothetical protein JXA09_12435 [Anaerolineae bacterium]|nr:hypothetical protein [Anaerolineae bacterium]